MKETCTPGELDELGKKEYRNKRYLEASQAFRAAAEGYRVVGDDLAAAEMANNCSVALLQGGEFQAALDAVEGSEAVFEAAGDVRRQAMAIGNRAAALESLDRLEEAIASYQQADELFKQIGEHEMRSPILQSLSTLQFKTGRGYEGLSSLNTGFEEGGKTSFRRRLLKAVTDFPIKILLRPK